MYSEAGSLNRDSAELGRLLDRLRRHSGTIGERREALIERVLADTFPPDRTASTGTSWGRGAGVAASASGP